MTAITQLSYSGITPGNANDYLSNIDSCRANTERSMV